MRLEPDQRRTVIITAAIREARDKGLTSVNHSSVAKRCVTQTSVHTVRHYFNHRTDLWRAVVEACPEMVEQGKELGL